MQRTKNGPDGASPLILVFGGQEVEQNARRADAVKRSRRATTPERFGAVLLVSGQLFLGLARCTPAPRPQVPKPSNPIAEYLDGAEVQAEEGQEENICQALRDLAFISRNDLRRRRYADYQGTPDAWDLHRLLHAHFVPDAPKSLPRNEEFWTYVDDENVRRLARELHDCLKCGSGNGRR